MRVALVSREVYPLTGGGIGTFVSAAARLLSRIAEVTIVTSSNFESVYEELCARRDPRLPGAEVRLAFAREPASEEAASWYDVVQCYGERVLDCLREAYPDGGPDVVEFPDYLGEAFVPLQAAGSLDPFFESSCLCVRLHSTQELVSVLNAHYRRDFASRAQFEMERYALRHADRLIWQGGDILGTYGRFYGAQALAPAIRIRYPYGGTVAAAGSDDGFECGSPLRALYAGRLERRKGVETLVRAFEELDGQDIRLTLIGADTPTGPLGVSMRDLLELTISGDGRIKLRDPTDRASLAGVIREHDVVVVPSLWECWPYAALEALHLNRPLLATPVGGLAELVEPGTSGWLAGGTDSTSLAHALQGLVRRQQEVRDLVRAEAPLARGAQLSDERDILDGYQALARLKPRRGLTPASVARAPLVSAIVPYYRSSRYVGATVESLLAQTYTRVEIVLVNDGSFEDDDWVLAELAAQSPVVVLSQMNSGLGAARNFGIAQSHGRYVLPLDADNLVEPEFLSRCVEVLEAQPQLAYATSWSRYIDAGGELRPGPDLGYQPLGNWSRLVADDNVAGDAAAVIRRSIFDLGFAYSEELTSYEDWHFYRELARAGHYGAVIPERLLRYRVHEQSMLANIGMTWRGRLDGEMKALLRENEVRWTS